jgi:hypothetical protein
MVCVVLDSFGHIEPDKLKLLKIGSKIDYFYLSEEDETLCNDVCSGTIQGFVVDASIIGRAYTLTANVREQIDSGELFYWLDDKKLTKILAIKVISNGIKSTLDTNWLRIERICGPQGPKGGRTRRRSYRRSRY